MPPILAALGAVAREELGEEPARTLEGKPPGEAPPTRVTGEMATADEVMAAEEERRGETTVVVGKIGLSPPTSEMAYTRASLGESIVYGYRQTVGVTSYILGFLKELVTGGISPRSVMTPRTWPSSVRMAVTVCPPRNRAPPSVARRAWASDTRMASVRPSDGTW